MSKKILTCRHTKREVEYVIEDGFDAERVKSMHSSWGAAKVDLVTEILSSHPECRRDPAKLFARFGENNAEDFHWDWIMKACVYNTDEYYWFYLIADHLVQAVCIIYHPRSSNIDSEKIFYVDYLATAFWNRQRPGYERRFSGLGKILLSHSITYAANKLGYRPGFSLHSLPKAESFYRNLGMKDFGKDVTKENLTYFEAEAEIAKKLAGLTKTSEEV